jgi:hypothetical protein
MTLPEKSIIFLEFNELCPSLMQQFIQAGKLPNFERFYQESEVYTTDAEEQPPFLEPWIQWVTVHTGQPYRAHQIFYLDEGHKLKFPAIWDVLSQAGYRVWVCGSMNSRYDAPLNGYFLPDYWSTQQTPHPQELRPFFNFVSRYVQEHTNAAIPLSWRDYWTFLVFMVTHGLSWATVWAIAQQLWKERRTGRYRWQRATLLDKFQWDVFRWYYRKFKPHFSTFFLNSTAHFQHMYWRNMQPEHFQVQPLPQEQAEYENAILYGYQEMDKLIGECLQLVDGQTTLMLCTGLSQQPCFTYEAIGGKHLYRPYRFEEVLKFAGIQLPYVCSPVMAEEFFIRFDNEEDACIGEQRLAALRVDGRAAMRLRRQGSEIYAGCGIFDLISEQAILTTLDRDNSLPFFKLFYQIEEIKSGMHHPDGILWIRRPTLNHTVHLDKVSLLSIPAKILQILPVASLAKDKVQQLT